MAPHENHSNIGIKWKLNKDGEIVMKNIKLVVQGYCQKKKKMTSMKHLHQLQDLSHFR